MGRWKIRKADRDAGVVSRTSERAETSIKMFRKEGQTFEDQQATYKLEMATQALRIAEVIAETGKDKLLVNADKIAKLDATARKALNLEEAKPSTVINIGFLQGRNVESVPYLSPNQVHTLVEDTGNKPVAQVVKTEKLVSEGGASGGVAGGTVGGNP